jgi:hypothetical protein
MSIRHELLGKIVLSNRGIVPVTAGPVPSRVCGRTVPGTEHLSGEPLSGIYPEPLGKIIPSNSGPVPMTAGRFPV